MTPADARLFDLPPEVAAARRAAVRAADRFEARELDYFARVRQTYLGRVAADPDRFVADLASTLTEVVSDPERVRSRAHDLVATS